MRDEVIRVVLVDDHTIVQEGLRLLLRSAPDIAVVGEADSGLAAIDVAGRTRPDIVVLDLDMPGSDGMAALRGLEQARAGVKVLVLTVHPEREQLVPLLEAGARGYLTKAAASEDLVDAIRVVAAGEVYVRPAAARLLAAAVVPQHAAKTARDRFDALSDRERTTLRLVAEGYTGAEIARQIGISTKTIDTHRSNMYRKLSLRNQVDLVRFATMHGIGLSAAMKPTDGESVAPWIAAEMRDDFKRP